LRAPAGFVAAIAVIGSGMVMSRSLQFEQFTALAWLPWVLIGVDWVVRSPRSTRWSVPFLAAVIATMVLGGHPQGLYMYAPFVAVWAVVRSLDAHAVDRLPLVIGAGVLGLFLAAPHLLPAALFASHAAHVHQTLQSVSARDYVLPARRVVQAVLGDVFAPNPAFPSSTFESVTSIGAAASALALIGAFATLLQRRAVRWTAAALVAVGAGALVLALGPRTVVFRTAFRIVPGFDGPRVPARWRDLVVLCAALLAAFAIDHLRSARISTRVATASIGTAALIVVAIAVGPFELPEAKTMVVWAALSVGCFATLALVRLRQRWSGLLGAGLAAALVLVEVGSVVPTNFLRVVEQPAGTAQASSAAANYARDAGGRIMAITIGVSSDPQYLVDGLRTNANVLVGVRSIDGYDGGVQVTKEWTDAVRALEGDEANTNDVLGGQLKAPLDPQMWARFGVRFVFVDRDVVAAPQTLVPAWKGPVVVDGPFELYENPAYQAEAHLYTSTQPLDPSTASGVQIGALGDREASVALVDANQPALSCAGTCERQPVVLDRPHAGEMRAESDVRVPSLLVTDEHWDEGWSVTVDGRDAPVVRVDGFFTAVALAPGHHVVAWSYRAPGLRSGLILFALALLVCVAIAAGAPARLRRRFRSTTAAPPT
ncbi:MAG: hypothetical protein QOD38_345, partial [Acidimicrobiaceae bacterium]